MSSALPFTITVVIEPDSLASFAAAGACLYAFPSFRSSNRTGVPLVMDAVSQLARTNAIRFEGTWQAFASFDDLADGQASSPRRTVSAGSDAPVRPGDVVSVGPSLTLAASSVGIAGAATFRTAEPGRLTCGLAFGPGRRPGCAATLTAAFDVAFAPTHAILLMVSTCPFAVGAWVERTTGQALLVDMAGTDARTVTVDPSAPGGWREADQAWARAIPAGTSLTDVLRLAPHANEPL